MRYLLLIPLLLLFAAVVLVLLSQHNDREHTATGKVTNLRMAYKLALAAMICSSLAAIALAGYLALS